MTRDKSFLDEPIFQRRPAHVGGFRSDAPVGAGDASPPGDSPPPSDLDRGRSRLNDPATSNAAARSIGRAKIADVRAEVLRVLADRPNGKSDFEIVSLVRGRIVTSESGVRTRRAELVAMRLVEACGERTLPTGRAATLWRLTPAGMVAVYNTPARRA